MCITLVSKIGNLKCILRSANPKLNSVKIYLVEMSFFNNN